uniref:Uncharacterized protein n=1 Tax=Thermosporothrix sp. COM3 TaxID=2490863 RepID=A0A455SDB5_9CHLR|nr:hypothetical protein KTC_11880 [Thermosporothrix sp. COM3]
MGVKGKRALSCLEESGMEESCVHSFQGHVSMRKPDRKKRSCAGGSMRLARRLMCFAFVQRFWEKQGEKGWMW